MEGPRIRTEATPVPLHYQGQVTVQGLTTLRRRLADWAVSANLDADTVDAVVDGTDHGTTVTMTWQLDGP